MSMKIDHLTARWNSDLVHSRDTLALAVRMWSTKVNAGKWFEKEEIEAAPVPARQ